MSVAFHPYVGLVKKWEKKKKNGEKKEDERERRRRRPIDDATSVERRRRRPRRRRFRDATRRTLRAEVLSSRQDEPPSVGQS